MFKKIFLTTILTALSFCVCFFSIRNFQEAEEIKVADFVDNYVDDRQQELPPPDEEYPAYMVKIHSYDKLGKRTNGTGVVIGRSAYYTYILTNIHVLDTQYKINCSMYDKMNYSSDIIYLSKAHDLAVIGIHTNKNYSRVKMNFNPPEEGEKITSLGNIADQGITTTSGEVCVFGMLYGEEKIVTNAYNSFGGSGGALLNEKGEMIGLNVSIHTEKTLSYAIPLYAVKDEIIDYVGNIFPSK